MASKHLVIAVRPGNRKVSMHVHHLAAPRRMRLANGLHENFTASVIPPFRYF